MGDTGKDVKQKMLAIIMKKELSMTYKKIKTVTVRTNSEKNLILSQQFALNLIKVLLARKRIINIDQI